MLVLSRKERQQIRIGEGVVVTVTRISGDTVRLGIQAPKSVTVLREELLSRPAVQETAGPVLLRA